MKNETIETKIKKEEIVESKTVFDPNSGQYETVYIYKSNLLGINYWNIIIGM